MAKSKHVKRHVDHVMFLGEHQASWNNNMPLRGLFYFARLYQEYVDTYGYDLYGVREIPLPFPMYVVFYNGLAEKPEKSVLRLSERWRDHTNMPLEKHGRNRQSNVRQRS